MNNGQGGHHFQRSQNNHHQYRGGVLSNSNNMHSNVTFTEFQGGAESSVDSRGTTRIVFANGNADRGLRYCDIENGRYCELSATNGLVETTGNFQFHNYGRGKPFRHQTNSFRGCEGYVQRNYVHPQGLQTQERFVKIQGGKMGRHGGGGGYRNFMQHKHNKQFRGRYNPQMNHLYKQQRNFELNPDSIQVQKEVQEFLAQQRELQQQHALENRNNFVDASRSPGNQSSSRSSSKSSKRSASSTVKGKGSDDNSDRSCRSRARKESGSKPVGDKDKRSHMKNGYSPSPPESKTPSPNCRSHNLSYEDVTENSDENETEEAVADLRERLLWKKHCDHVVKREPGEIDSDEDENPEFQQPKKKVKLEKPSKDHDAPAKSIPSSTNGAFSDESRSEVSLGSKNKLGKDSKKEEKRAAEKRSSTSSDESKKKNSGVNQNQHRSPYSLPYSGHDDRFQGKQTHVGKASTITRSPEVERKKECGSSPNDSSDSSKFCEGESREKVGNLQRALRETRDKLLETRVVASKKALRTKQEIDQLNAQLDDAAKKESDLKAALKSMENELTTKRLELAKMTTLHDVELREKEKFRADLTRTYQDRLTIEIDKLRALFDIELAKMQAFYLAQNLCFEDGSGVNFMKGTSECEDRSQNQSSSKMSKSDGLQPNIARSESDLNSNGLSGAPGIPFMHSSYFDYPAMPSAQFGAINGYQNGLFKCPSSVSNHSQSRSSPTSSSSATSADSGFGGSMLNVAFGHHRVRSSASPSPTSFK